MFFTLIFNTHLALFVLLFQVFNVHVNLALLTTFITLGLSLTVCEFLMPRQKHPPRKSFFAHAFFVIFDQLLIRKALQFYFLIALVPFSQKVVPNFDLWPYHWPLFFQSALTFLLMTLAGYWSHRLMHTVPLFWQFHRLHHLPHKMTWFVTFWNHPLHSFMNFTALLFFPLILHIPQNAIIYPMLLNILVGTLNHANVKTTWSPLNILFPSINEHEIHHSKDFQTAKHNYGISTLLWDYVFKTYKKPSEELKDFGINNFDETPKNTAKALLWPFYGRKATTRETPAKSLKN